MQFDIAELVRVWLIAAQDDLIAAETLMQRLPHIACFHAQQAANKALRAVLVQFVGDAPRTHIVSALLRDVRALEPALPDQLLSASALDQFYIPTRYPDALGGAEAMFVYSETHARDAIAQTRAVCDWAKSYG